jgi:hypothetical protein
LVGAFVKKYKFNIDIALDRSSLLIMEKGKEAKRQSESMPKSGEKRLLRSSPC